MRVNATLKQFDGRKAEFEIFGYKPALDSGELYTLEIKPYKSKRSLDQNALMWAIIQEISRVTGNDEMDVYSAGLEEVNVKADFFMGLPETEDVLRRQFRAVKIMENREYNGKMMTVYKCYEGSSKFNTEEMTRLIDYFMKLADESGVYGFESLSA